MSATTTDNPPPKISDSAAIFKRIRPFWAHIGVVAGLFGLFIVLITVSGNIYSSMDNLGQLDGLRGFYGVERQLKDDQGNVIPYSWTYPEASINYRNVSQIAPLELTLKMSLARPENFPPARLEVRLRNSRNQDLGQLTVFEFRPERAGFEEYKVTIPKGLAPGEPDFTVVLLTNGFKPGDGRELGIRITSYELKMLTGWRQLFIWPDPYVPAVFLLLVSLLVWSIRVGLGWLETGLFAGGLVIAAAYSAQYIQAQSWWLCECAMLFGLAGWLYNRDSKSEAYSARNLLLPVLLACFAIIGFFVASWPAVYDTRYYIDWNRDIAANPGGPFGIYGHSESLNYTPLITYLLWFYGLIANPLGLGDSYTAVKFFLALAVPLLVVVVWKLLYKREDTPTNFPAILLLLGVSAGAFYNPVVYGQSDAPLALFLVWGFLLANQGKIRWAGVILAFSLLYKLQTIYLLPLLAVLMLRRGGWLKTGQAALLGLAIILIVAAPAYGFSWNEFVEYFTQGQLAGQGELEYGGFNLLYLLNANNGEIGWIIPVTFGVIGLVYLGLVWHFWRGKPSEWQLTLACGLVLLVCIEIGIKSKQHYFYYPLPFLGLAALYKRNLLKPWLAWGIVYTIMLAISPVISRRDQIFDNFLLWNRLVEVGGVWLRNGLALAGLLISGGLLIFYWLRRRTSRT